MLFSAKRGDIGGNAVNKFFKFEGIIFHHRQVFLKSGQFVKTQALGQAGIIHFDLFIGNGNSRPGVGEPSEFVKDVSIISELFSDLLYQNLFT